MPQPHRHASIFTLRTPESSALHRPSRLTLIEKLLGLDRCQALYEDIDGQSGEFLTRVLQALKISPVLRPGDMERIPAKGPLVVVANHPFGAVDGILLTQLLRQVRPDVKILGNYLLERIPQMRELIIPVDPFDQDRSARRNIAPVRQAIRYVRDGGALVIFPAGEVSHLQVRRREITDPSWDVRVAPLLRHAGAPVLPVYFPGGNSPLFHLLGLLHPRMRTALLPHELLNKQHRRIDVRIGAAIPYKKLTAVETDAALMDFLRVQTYLLGNTGTREATAPPEQKHAPLIPPLDEDLLALEVRRLPSRQKIAVSGELEAYLVDAGQIPSILREIGRLRELTFRRVGEGTGQSIDIDRFDFHYQHLFLWNPLRREVVGAYRLGRADVILEEQGLAGLYSHTLFALDRRLFEQTGPALELGRSFVRPEYQKSYAPLLLLWKGIGRFVALNPQYRHLFGPVSISQDYHPLARSLMIKALRSQGAPSALRGLVRPRTPFRSKTIRLSGCSPRSLEALSNGLEQVDGLVAALQPELGGIPVLMRHYLNLGGRILEFNCDPDFSDVIDGFILVDLMQAPLPVLGRTMGSEAATTFRRYHETTRRRCA